MPKPQRPKHLRAILKSFKKASRSKSSRFRLVLLTLATVLIFTIVAAFFLLKDVPSPQKLTKSPAPVSTKILDRNGALLYEVYSEQNRTPIKISDLPVFVKDSTISIEDKNFYRHFGLDFQGIIRAAFKTLTGKRLEGGSTITQQLVKNALLSDPKRTLTRKIREAVLSLATEIIYTKDEILELYLNHAPYGGTAYGIEAASQSFFDKSARDLTLAEAALLAGLPQAPTKYSPFGANPDMAIKRQAQVLRRLVEDGKISPEQSEAARKEKLVFATKKIDLKAPHFSLMVRDLLVERFGEEKVNLGGLRVTTSLDLALQESAQATLSSEVSKLQKLKISNGAALIVRPNTGEILAMIGSK
ncbi:penicillin-binding protein, partial [Candidatus Collierbacteria bacterium]|nr:penicillin-binding protein [Candidatus Collierbacteria bacterium]